MKTNQRMTITDVADRMAELSILAWEGIGNSEDQLAEVTPEAVAALMDLWPIADAFERLYLGPTLVLEQEKND